MTDKLATLFKQAGKQDTDTSIMTVTAVDRSEGTCSCNDGDIEHTDVRLSAIIDDSKQKFLLIPKVGSTVLVTPIDQDYNMQFVSACSEIEELALVIEQCEFKVDKEGFLLKKENETLRGLMVDLLKAIRAMKFTTNAGPTIKLINSQSFIDIEERFKGFLKEQ